MSYNREWDRGKDWEGSSGYRGVSRGREDDEEDAYVYGDGKRRKHTYGDYDSNNQSTYDQRYTAHNADRNYDSKSNYEHEYNQYHGTDDYHQDRDRNIGSFPNRKRHVASEPSPHVIFLGLEPDFTEADLQKFLQGRKCQIETVTIIRDRNTGQSKGFGFAQFQSTEDARAFVDPNFPFVAVPPPASYGASAAAAFWKSEETGGSFGGRRVKIDYSQSAGGGGRRGLQASNDGTRDIGNTQCAVLLLRGLEPLTGPAAIGQAMKASSGPNVEGAKGMKRVLLIKDRTTMASWGYAFVEFVDIQSASAMLAASMSPQLHPNGFRISDRPIAVSFAHPYSFQAISDPLYQDETCVPSSLNLGGVEGTWVKYWDESSTVAMIEYEVAEPQNVQGPQQAKEKKEKKRAKVEEKKAAPTEASTLPLTDKPVTLSFNKAISLAKSGPVQQTPNVALFAAATEEDDDENGVEAGNKGKDDTDAKAKQAFKVPPMIASKKTVNNISKWTKVQEELSGATPAPEAQAPPPKSVTPPTAAVTVKKRSPTPEVEVEFEFSDTVAFSCLLCSRQFKSLDQLKRHNKESELHKKNFKDTSLRTIARTKAQAAKAKRSDTPTDPSESKPQYRDRALQRRLAFNQPDVPLPESDPTSSLAGNGKSSSNANTKRSAEGPPRPLTPPVAVAPAKDESNVGNKLLKMMGWTEGSGLGNDGEGRVDPVATAIYASGAGLGSSKGREVGKYQEGYSGYVQAGKDLARERFKG